MPRPSSRRAAEEPLGDVLGFMQLIWTLDHGLQKTSKRMAATIGLTGPQRLAIRIVGRRPGISPGELASVLRLHQSTITGVLQRLETRRLVARRRDPRDSRRSRLRLTSAGRRHDVPTAHTVETAVRAALAGFSASEIDAARRVLAELGERLFAPPGAPGRVS